MSTNINSTEQIVEINAGDQITNVNIVSQSTTQVISGEQVVTVDVNAGTIPAAWGSITGTLSNQTDLQTALNLKQNQISLTTQGTSGAATFIGSVLNIPNYTDTGLTSVGLAMPEAFTVSGSPLTSNGTITVLAAGTGAQYIKGDGSLGTFPTTIDQSLRLIREVYNNTGATLTKGTIVYINGGQGNLPTVTKALATGDATSAQTFGVVQSDITNQNNGYVVVAGGIDNLDTQAFSVGAALYLSPTTAGQWTTTKPYAPDHLVYIGTVVRSHPTQGVVEVRIANGYELDEIHNVSARFPVNKDGLFYNSTSGVWENKSIEGVLGYTPVPQSRIITINGTAQDLSADRTYNVGTVTQVAASGGTGISVTGSPVTGSGTITITNTAPDQVVGLTGAGTTSISGTYPNFTITSNDQYTGTVTSVAASGGTGISISGSPITSSGTINITNTAPDQIVSLTGAGTTSISGTYPNFTVTSNDQYVGTVTSVNATVPTGFEVSGVPITSAGTVDIKFASGYSLPTTAKQTQWDDAYAKRINSLTVTGNSGSSTLVSNVLNVPTYTLTGLGGEPAITAGTTSQYWRGDKSFQTLDTSVVPENGNVYFTEPRVRATVLSGLNITGGSISASDSVLNAFGKVQNQINGLIGGSIFQSTWNASTNTPSLASGVGTKGYYYIVSVAGTTNLDGITDWQIGDWAIFDGTVWRKVDNTDAVVSVNGYTGVVNLVLDDLADVSAALPTSNQLLRFNGTSSKWENWTPNYLTTITLTGDVTGSGTSSIATTIGAGKVTNAMLAGSINYSKMDSATVPTWNQDTTGNAATADKWKTARTLTIGLTGKSVDGSANVTWSASDIGLTDYLPLTGGTLTGILNAKTSISVSNDGAQDVYLQATSNYTDGYRAILRLSNTYTGGKSWDLYSTNNSDGDYGGGKLVFRNASDSVNALIITNTGIAKFIDDIYINGGATGNYSSVIRSAGNTAFRIFATEGGGVSKDIELYTSGSNGYGGYLKIVAAGAATFSSSITATSATLTSQVYNSLLLSGSSAATAPMAVYVNHYPNSDNTKYFAQYGGNWASPNNWGMGVRGTNDNTIYLSYASSGIIDPTSTVIELQIGAYKAVKSNRTLTINGTSYDLSADRTWNVGTITGSGTANQLTYWSGSSAITGSATLTYTPTSELLINNSVTAASAIARGLNLTSTLTAAANSDVLVGAEINSSFSTGAYTGVKKYSLRASASSMMTTIVVDISGTAAAGVGSQFLLADGGTEVAYFRRNRDNSGVTELTNTDGTLKLRAGTTPADAIVIDSSANVSISKLTSNGFVKTTGGTGALSIDTTTYAVDSTVVHLAGTETITGAKTFTAKATFNSTGYDAILLNGGGGGYNTNAVGIFNANYPNDNTKYYAQYGGNWPSPNNWGMGVRGTSDKIIYISSASAGVIDVTDTGFNLQIGAYRALHAGNYNSYALPLTGGTLTGALSGTSATFSGTIGIGTAASAFGLDVLLSDANTNGIIGTVQIGRKTTGTAANGIGGNMQFTATDNAGTQRTAAYITWKLADVTAASPKGYLSIGSRNASEALKIDDTGAASFSSSVTIGTGNGGTQYFGDNVYRGLMSYSAGTGLWYFNNQSAGASTINYFQFQADGTGILTLKKSGAATFSSTVSGTQYTSTSSSASLPGFATASGVGMYNAGTNTIGFSTNSTSRLLIDDNYVYIKGANTVANKNTILYSNSSNFSIYTTEGGGTTKDFILYTSGSSGYGGFIFVQGSNGYFGVATNSPAYHIDVNPGTTFAGDPTVRVRSSYADGYRASLRLTNSHTGGRDYAWVSTNNSDGVFGGGKLGIYDYTAGAQRYYMDSSGNNYYTGLICTTNRVYNAIYLSGASGAANPMGVFVNDYPSSDATKYYAHFGGNWASSGNWGIGINGSADSTVYLGQSSGGVISTAASVNFKIWGNSYAAAFFENSDKRQKELIQDNYIVKGIENISAKYYKKNGVIEIGYFAQELEGLLDSAISKTSDGFLNLSYSQVHTAKIAALENEIKQLKIKLNELGR